MSLGLRLTLLNGLVLLLAIGAFAAVAYVTQVRALGRGLDSSLQEQVLRVGEGPLQRFERGAGRPGWMLILPPGRLVGPDVFIQVVDRTGEVRGRSRNLGDATLPFDQETLQRALSGESWFTEVELEGQPLRLFVAPLRGRSSDGPGQPVGMILVARPLEPLRSSVHSLQSTFLAIGAGSIVVALLAGWLLARAALRPIDRLAAVAQAIGAARDFGRRVPLPEGGHRDEVGRLAEEFNRMLTRLQEAYQQQEAMLQSQRRFVADASHELRTPLAVLRGNLDLLRGAAGAPDAEEQAQLLADMAAETERMSRLVADLLLLAQADAGQHLTLAPTEFGAVVRDAFRAARFFREEVELRLGEVPNDVWVQGDADRLKQVLLILLDNALKYTPAGGRVTLDAARAPRHGVEGVVARVEDTGPGIPPEERERIFERFYQRDRAHSTGGAGLGLAIARWIVEEHRGVIEVDTAPGGGSLFTIWLPTIAAPLSAAAVALSNGHVAAR